MAIELKISKGLSTKIDAETLERLKAANLLKWNAQKSGIRHYVSRNYLPAGKRGKKAYKKLFLHRFILDAPDDLLVDHIDGDPLNNCKSNLRLAFHRQNARHQVYNRKIGEYRGVSAVGRSYSVQIQMNKKHFNIGHFRSKHDAARVYDLISVICFGEFASPNFEVSKKFLRLRAEILEDAKFCKI